MNTFGISQIAHCAHAVCSEFYGLETRDFSKFKRYFKSVVQDVDRVLYRRMTARALWQERRHRISKKPGADIPPAWKEASEEDREGFKLFVQVVRGCRNGLFSDPQGTKITRMGRTVTVYPPHTYPRHSGGRFHFSQTREMAHRAYIICEVYTAMIRSEVPVAWAALPNEQRDFFADEAHQLAESIYTELCRAGVPSVQLSVNSDINHFMFKLIEFTGYKKQDIASRYDPSFRFSFELFVRTVVNQVLQVWHDEKRADTTVNPPAEAAAVSDTIRAPASF